MKLPGSKKSLRAGGILTKLLLMVGLFFLVVAIAWVLWLPDWVVSRIQSKTGFTVKVDQLSVNPFTAKVAIKGAVLKNPAGWPVQDFLDLREFRAEAELGSLFTNRYVANEVVIDVARCTMVKNSQGVMNATVFSNALGGGSSTNTAGEKGEKKAFLIKHLVLKFDALVYADYSKAKPAVKEYRVNINRELRDVDSVAKIVNPIANASISVITDALSGVANGRTDLLKDAAEAIQSAGKKSGEKLKSLLDSLDKKKP